jgi:hypothetical protein
MRDFPSKFTSANLAQFQQFKYDRDICYLREAIYEYYLNEKPEVVSDIPGKDYRPYEEPFDLQKFIADRNPPRLTDMLKTIGVELEKLGWKTVVGHANSAFWIYPAVGKPPKSLPEW